MNYLNKPLFYGLLATLGWLAYSPQVWAQHEHHTMSKPDTSAKKPTTHKHTMQDTSMHAMHQLSDVPMSHSFSLNLPMNRNGSGTGWLPDASPMYGVMLHSKKWMYMLHGSIFFTYTHQDISQKGSRGGDEFNVPNWFMFMAQRKVGQRGLFRIGTMLSLDRLTSGGSGYPLLFQSGESWEGKPLVDRQHPHDLVSELSVGYSYALSPKADVFVYLGYPGEPALGSVAFMHRPSALNYPDAPLSHHWNDGTHITFGVATVGFRFNQFKLEASSFTGREPDEDRYSFDTPRFDSWSTRLSYNPSANWAFQVSHGWVKSPEALHSDEDIQRTTASVITSYRLGDESYFNATALWGRNKGAGHNGENAALAEASWTRKRLAFYGRYEWVQKSGEELNLSPDAFGDHTLFPVQQLTAGSSYDLLHSYPLNIAIGGQVSLAHADSRLDGLYGKNPVSAQVFVRIYPALMRMGGMKMKNM